LATTLASNLLFPDQARGSLIRQGERVVGSRLIGQAFTSPRYFHPRPSATSPEPYNAALSGGSNLGPTNAKLIQAVQERVRQYRRENGLAEGTPVPVDAVTASASGLDPDISLANAQLQAPRVAKARGIPLERVQRLIQAHTRPRQLGVLGEPRVNVLELNLALDDLR
jgi:K+-transporting ATPase ATPase C chain